MTQILIMETVQHTNFLFDFVETLAKSKIWLGLCGAGLTVVPIIGIMIVHKQKNFDEKNHN